MTTTTATASKTATFRITALDAARFAPLLGKTDEELARLGARRVRVHETPGFPCRVSLEDAEPGESMLLLPFSHHDVDGPYRSSGPIFVRPGARTARPAAGEIPAVLERRLLSVRAYDAAGLMRAADVVEGTALRAAIEGLFSDRSIAYLHVHAAKTGCFLSAVERTSAGV